MLLDRCRRRQRHLAVADKDCRGNATFDGGRKIYFAAAQGEDVRVTLQDQIVDGCKGTSKLRFGFPDLPQSLIDRIAVGFGSHHSDRGFDRRYLKLQIHRRDRSVLDFYFVTSSLAETLR